MTIVILNYATAEVEMITDVKSMQYDETEEQLQKWGFRLSEIKWMSVDSDDVPVSIQSVDEFEESN